MENYELYRVVEKKLYDSTLNVIIAFFGVYL